MRMALPVSPDTICLWVADSAQTLTYETIRVYLHGIATTHVEFVYPSPLESGGTIWRMFKGVKRLQEHSVTRTRLPVTVEILEQLERWQEVTTTQGLLLRAAPPAQDMLAELVLPRVRGLPAFAPVQYEVFDLFVHEGFRYAVQAMQQGH
jgi:hypothetical protein